MNGVEEAPPPVPEARRGLLGEILIREGLIDEGQLSMALMVQRETEPTTPLGQILVRQGAITQRQLNNVLDRYRKKYRLGDILVETETITEHQLQIALDHQKKTGLRLGDALLQLNFVTEEEVNQALCKQFGVTFVDLDRLVLDNSLAMVINREYAERHRVIPISKTDRVLVVAMDDPSDLGVVAELAAATGSRVNVVTSTHAAFRRAFARTYGESAEAGLVRRTEQMGREYEVLRAAHEASKEKLAELRRAHEVLQADREASTRALAEQRTRNEWNEQALSGLRDAHAVLRADYESVRSTLEKLRIEYAEGRSTRPPPVAWSRGRPGTSGICACSRSCAPPRTRSARAPRGSGASSRPPGITPPPRTAAWPSSARRTRRSWPTTWRSCGRSWRSRTD